MKISIHQPEHMPYLGFFHKMTLCDKYIILDDVQFTKNNWQNRNRIVDKKGNQIWLTVPVYMKGHTDMQIREMRIQNSRNWRVKYWRTVKQNYSKHHWFAQYKDRLKMIVMEPYENLIDLNMALIMFYRDVLKIDCPIIMSSSLGVVTKKSERIIDICAAMDATTYLSGVGAKDYLDETLFKDRGIALEFQRFIHPEYPAPSFVPYLSTLDLIMNCGEGSADVLRSA